MLVSYVCDLISPLHIFYFNDKQLHFFSSVGDDFDEVDEDENLDDLQEGEVRIYYILYIGWAKKLNMQLQGLILGLFKLEKLIFYVL